VAIDLVADNRAGADKILAVEPACVDRSAQAGTIAKLRWHIERDYEELKQELGLGHFEGRNWRGFHHHATLSIDAYGFLVLEQCLSPPQTTRSPSAQPTSSFAYPVCNPITRPEALLVL
jgi:hypothetical protein